MLYAGLGISADRNDTSGIDDGIGGEALFDLEGKTAIVTGGAQGIGAAISCGLAARGAQVIVGDIKKDSAEAFCHELCSMGLTAVPFSVDVGDSRQADALIAFAVEKFGKLDILCNNAGILRDCLITDLDDAEWKRIMDVNLDGVFYCSRAAIRHMVPQKSGKIINTASTGGKLGFPFAGVHYCASKGAVMAFTRQLAYQHAGDNIQVNAIAPGLTDTGMVAERTQKQMKFIRSKLITGRKGRPVDPASAVLFLASSEADFITGETINVNAGLFMD
jgi:3-oxoacyl-[acyl-carrier protein] reductase